MDHPRSRRSGSWVVPLRATPGSPRAARCRAGPAHVEEVTAPVTPCRCSPGPTVRDACGCTRGSAAPGGDVSGTDEVPVAPLPAVRAGEGASPRLGDTLVAFRAGGRRPPLVHEHDLDPRQLRLVRQAGEQMRAPPVAKRQVVAPPAVPAGDAPGVAHDHGAHPALHQPGHHRFGCLVVGLADPAAVAGLGSLACCPVAAPAPAPLLALAGGPSRRLLIATLRVLQVQAFLGPDLTSRDEEALVACHRGVGVDDPEVDPGGDAAVKPSALGRHRDLGRHVEVEPSRLGDEGDRAERLHRVGDRPAEAHPQLGCTPGDGEADPGPVDGKGSLPEAHRDQCPLAAGEAGPDAGLLAPGCFEECSRVVLEDRLCGMPGQLPEGRARELPAQGRVVGHLRAVPLTKRPVTVDHPGPRVPGGAQQAVAAPSLGRGGAQGDPGAAVDLPNRTHVRKDSEGYRQEQGHFRDPRKKAFSR